MRIILVRHGQSENNAGINDSHDSPLTKKGRMQAERLGKKLKKEKVKIDMIYTSDLIRSRETGKIISDILKVPIKTGFEGLNEYHHRRLVSRVQGMLNFRVRKLKKFLKEISKDRNKDKTILIAAHGITNRIILGILLGIPLRLPLMRLRHDNTGFSVLRWVEDFKNWNLESMNDIYHLPKNLR